MRDPSGDTAGSISSTGVMVSRRGSRSIPPMPGVASITARSHCCPSCRAKTMRSSAVQEGQRSSPGEAVRRVAAPPRAGTT
jgi:hypothetical protein